MKRALFGLSILLILFLLWFNWSTRYGAAKPVLEPISTPVITALDSDKLFSLVQGWRSENNLPKYIVDNRLCEIASNRAAEIVNNFSHQGLYEEYSNYPYVIQENLAENFVSEQKVLTAWIGSPTHLAILKFPYKYSCLVCTSLYCSEIFSSFKTDKNNPY